METAKIEIAGLEYILGPDGWIGPPELMAAVEFTSARYNDLPGYNPGDFESIARFVAAKLNGKVVAAGFEPIAGRVY